MKKILASLPVLLLCGFAWGEQPPASPAPDDPPETVMATFRAAPGKEDQLEKVIRRHWATVRRLGLVSGDLHLLFRSEDEPGKAMFVHIFTWKSHSVPDDAPPEVEKIWDEMTPLVEKRGGHRGIEFPEMKPIPLTE